MFILLQVNMTMGRRNELFGKHICMDIVGTVLVCTVILARVKELV